MHQTLYLAYRPTDFSAVVGQDHIVTALTSALRQNKVAHAYLLTGPRGTGKTSVGRLLAKGVNCEQARDDQPICNECDACQAIAAGNSLDVIEIDAASNRGIDDIRALRERVAFPPQALKKKVYIIDEVHMLTPEAFNALLKTLEEPPAHVLFILATTEPQRVPITIQSRCQRLDFRRGTPADLLANLRRVATAEQLTIDDAALALIAELAEGGYRDSLTLLERTLGSTGPVNAAVVRQLFGLGDEGLVEQLIASLVAGERTTSFKILAEAESKGVNPPYLAQTVVYTLRHLLYAKAGAVKASAWEATIGNKMDLTAIRTLCEYWMNAAIDSRRSPVPLLPLEIAAARWLEQTESVAPPASPPIAAPPVSTPLPAAAPPTSPPAADPAIAIAPDQWAEVVSLLVAHNHSISKLLQASAIGRITAGKLPIYVHYPFHKETLAQKGNYDILAKTLQTVLKQTVIPDIQVGQPPADAMRVSTTASAGEGDILQNVSDVFATGS